MKLLFIISGSIAAKRNIEILKFLIHDKFYIDCIVTESAKKIINTNLIKKIINGKMYSNNSEIKKKMLHIELARNADLILICPATANIIAKFANGYANDLASTTLIASNKKILIIPAMNKEMWNNKVNKNNVFKLKKIGIEFIGPIHGNLSCGEIGMGRIANTNTILERIYEEKNRSKTLFNKKCIVTAGPTIEPIDPIRYISNYSSGKQGYEIAKQLSINGAKVILISGPTNLEQPSGVKTIFIKTAKEMNNQVLKNLKNTNVAVFAAAVSDIKVKKISSNKIKKDKINNIQFIKNPDILKNSNLKKKLRPDLIIGFAAETKNLISNAKNKMLDKGCDWIVANKIDNKNRIFGSDYNKIVFIKKNKIIQFKKTTKTKIAINLVNEITKHISKVKKI